MGISPSINCSQYDRGFGLVNVSSDCPRDKRIQNNSDKLSCFYQEGEVYWLWLEDPMSQIEDFDDRIKKERSPSFPFISLPKSIDRARAFAEAHRRNPARLQAVSDTWGYAPSSSGLQQTIAALKSYGLLEDLGRGADRKVQLTELGWRILQDARPGAKESAYREAALRPRFFAEMAEKWVPERPSDGHCISELTLDRGFTTSAAQLFLKVFDETVSFAGLRVSDNLSETTAIEETMESEGSGAVSAAIRRSGAAILPAVSLGQQMAGTTAGEPYRMEIIGNRVNLLASLETAEQIEELIRRLQFAKMMITPSSDQKSDDKEAPN
jgi:hypothetical protein